MSTPGASELYISARGALLDALDALAEHREALVLVGAQAIYIHTGEADVAIATTTKDGDIVVNPDILRDDPLIEHAMEGAGFTLNLERRQPGEWLSPAGVPVDLLVPEALGGAGRRGARIPPHAQSAARKVTGLEPSVVDNEVKPIAGLEPSDERRFELRVAGPSALLIAKLHKLSDRRDEGRNRLLDKDAHDVYRLLRAVPTATFAERMSELRAHELAGDVTNSAVTMLSMLFGTPESLGAQMAGRAEVLVGDPDVTAASAAALALDLLEAL
jgi:Nucleotidyltransferase